MKRKHDDETEQMSDVVPPKIKCTDSAKQTCFQNKTFHPDIYQERQTRIEERFLHKLERKPIYINEIQPRDHHVMRDLAYNFAVKKLRGKKETYSGTTKSVVEFPPWKDTVLRNVWRSIYAEIQEEATSSVAESDLELSSDSSDDEDSDPDEDPDLNYNIDQDASTFGIKNSQMAGVTLSRIFDQSRELCPDHRQMLDDGNLILESDSLLTYAPLESFSTEDFSSYENDCLMSDLYSNYVADPNMEDAFSEDLSLEDMFNLVGSRYFHMEPSTPLMPLTPVTKPLTPVMEPLTPVIEPSTPVMEIDYNDSSSLNLSLELQYLENLNFDSDLENLV